jgi:hypothetical protein
MEQTFNQSVDSEHSRFDHEQKRCCTSAVIQNMKFYILLEFFPRL